MLQLFQRIAEEDLYYLKDTVTDTEVIHDWTHNINWERVIPIEAVVGGVIVADATLHRSRVFARRHVAEIRVVDPHIGAKAWV